MSHTGIEIYSVYGYVHTYLIVPNMLLCEQFQSKRGEGGVGSSIYWFPEVYHRYFRVPIDRGDRRVQLFVW